METVDELTEFLTQATEDGVRGRLQARGEARAIIRQDGVLPDDAPAFGETIDTDLAEYGFSLLRASLALREIEGNPEIWRGGFARAGNAFEALVQNGSPEGTHRGFFRVIGAASYHLAGYSALAFSLIAALVAAACMPVAWPLLGGVPEAARAAVALLGATGGGYISDSLKAVIERRYTAPA